MVLERSWRSPRFDPLVLTRTDPLPRPAAWHDKEYPLSSANPNGGGVGRYQPVLKIR